MINLLPQKEKDSLFLKRIRNLSIVLGSVLIIALLCLIFVLLSLKFYIMAEVDSQKFMSQATEQKYRSPDIETVKNAIQHYNELFPQITSFYNSQIHLSEVLAAIANTERPKGVRFTSISIISQDAGKTPKVSISGVSDTRENLLNFQKSLESQSMINNVLFSADSWISPVKAKFNLTLEYGN